MDGVGNINYGTSTGFYLVMAPCSESNNVCGDHGVCTAASGSEVGTPTHAH